MYALPAIQDRFVDLKKLPLERAAEYLSLVIFVLCTLTLLPLEMKLTGYGLLFIGTVLLSVTSSQFRKHFILIYLSLFILSITPIGTSTKPPEALYMALGLGSVVLLPFLITCKLYRDRAIQFPNFRDRNWPARRWLYLLFILVAAWLLLPFMLRDTGSYVN